MEPIFHEIYIQNAAIISFAHYQRNARAEETEPGGYDYLAVEKAEKEKAAKELAEQNRLYEKQQRAEADKIKKAKAKRAARLAEQERISMLPENMAKLQDFEICIKAGKENRPDKKSAWIEELVRRKIKFNPDAIKNHTIHLDDTECDIFAAYGPPKRYNRRVNKYGTNVQFVYDGLYIYTENGIVTSWSD